MTIIYTETHLTQDPIYNFEDNSATFSVALSDISVVCHIHRQDNIEYIRQNELRSGDLVKIQGVFVTSHSIDTVHTFIKIQTIALATTDISTMTTGTNIMKSKKRKLNEISIMKSNMESTIENYKEVGLDFSEYYFLLSGQAYCILDDSRLPTNDNNNNVIQAKARLLVNILTQLYLIYMDFTANGMTQLHVVNFVNTATSFMKTLNQIKNNLQGDLLPKNISLCQKTPLPSFIYHAYIYE